MPEPEELFNGLGVHREHPGMATNPQVPFLVLLGSLIASVAAFGDLKEGVIQAETPVVLAFP